MRIQPANQERWVFGGMYCEYFCGVQITVETENPAETQSIFLRMPELMRLMAALQDEMAICKEQFDWDLDYM